MCWISSLSFLDEAVTLHQMQQKQTEEYLCKGIRESPAKLPRALQKDTGCKKKKISPLLLYIYLRELHLFPSNNLSLSGFLVVQGIQQMNMAHKD